MACDASAWIDRELAGCRFADERLGRRLRALLGQMAGAMGESIPLACQDWANTKAAYRFLSSERFGEDAILAGHFQATAGRFAAARLMPLCSGPALPQAKYPAPAAGGLGPADSPALSCSEQPGQPADGERQDHRIEAE